MKTKIYLLLLGMILLIGSFGLPMMSAGLWNDGNMAYYSFDESTGNNFNNNVAPYNNNGTGMMANMAGGSGILGNGLKLNGSIGTGPCGQGGDGANTWGSYVQMPSFVRPTNNFTISFWFNLTKTDTWMDVVGMSDENTCDATKETTLKVGIYPNGGISGSVTLSNTTEMGFSNVGTAIQINKWYNEVLTYNGTMLSIYLNGTLISSRLVQGSLTTGTGLAIGASSDTKHYINQYMITGIIDEIGFWNRTLNFMEITDLYNKGAGLAYLSGNQILNLLSPSNNSLILTSNYLFNVSLSMVGTATDWEWTNNTYNIWYLNGTVFNITTVTGLSTNSTSTSKLFNINLGNYLWNSYACYNNATFGNCSWASNNYSFYKNSTINSNTYNLLGYETSTQNYLLNITSPTGYTPSSAYLVYNGTSYSITPTLSGSNYLLNKTLQISSSVIGVQQFYWKWNLSSTFAENTSLYNQTINPIQFGLCNATLLVPYLNLSFKNEATDGFIKASIPSSTFLYYLGDGSITKTLTFINNTANLLYTFCGLPSNQIYKIDPYVQYKNTTDYPQRIWDTEVGTYTNSSSNTNQTLYLLSSVDGIYVTYQVLDGTGGQLSEVNVIASRVIGGTTVIVAVGITDAAGTVTFWMNPDFLHTVSFSKTGYNSYSLNHFPTQSAYTLTLGSTSISALNDYLRGITWYIKPTLGTVLNSNQIYNFNLTLNSSYWTLDSFGFDLYGDGVLLSANSSYLGSGGFISVLANISNYSHININYYWIINGTLVNATSGGWITFNNEGIEWSIKNLFNNFKLFAGQGLFGLNSDSLNFIIFILIFIGVGIMSYKFSISSPATISGMVFALVWFFNVSLGLITVSAGVPYLPTILMGLIMIGFIVKEVTTN